MLALNRPRATTAAVLEKPERETTRCLQCASAYHSANVRRSASRMRCRSARAASGVSASGCDRARRAAAELPPRLPPLCWYDAKGSGAQGARITRLPKFSRKLLRSDSESAATNHRAPGPPANSAQATKAATSSTVMARAAPCISSSGRAQRPPSLQGCWCSSSGMSPVRRWRQTVSLRLRVSARRGATYASKVARVGRVMWCSAQPAPSHASGASSPRLRSALRRTASPKTTCVRPRFPERTTSRLRPSAVALVASRRSASAKGPCVRLKYVSSSARRSRLSRRVVSTPAPARSTTPALSGQCTSRRRPSRAANHNAVSSDDQMSARPVGARS
mmetsp:Transcript_7162/g.25076  ORF Transcript_7162/g.25076 Transcript_7162/m.25076 type:complete len:334 (-) Transcript_7162:30-1031(-)